MSGLPHDCEFLLWFENARVESPLGIQPSPIRSLASSLNPVWIQPKPSWNWSLFHSQIRGYVRDQCGWLKSMEGVKGGDKMLYTLMVSWSSHLYVHWSLTCMMQLEKNLMGLAAIVGNSSETMLLFLMFYGLAGLR